MKKILIAVLFLLSSCASVKKTIDEGDALTIAKHSRPFTIFAVGLYSFKTQILTLTDSKGQYFVIKIKSDESYKKGMIFSQ